MLVRACDSKQSIFLWLPFFCCFRQKKVTRRFSGGSFGFDLDVDLLIERDAARSARRCRGLRRSYPGESTPLRRLTTASFTSARSVVATHVAPIKGACNAMLRIRPL